MLIKQPLASSKTIGTQKFMEITRRPRIRESCEWV